MDTVFEELQRMIRHYVIMSSCYSEGARIALDFPEKEGFNTDFLTKTLNYIKKKCGEDVPLSTHFVIAESTEWSSVGKYDPFFSDVVCIENIDDFCSKVKRDRVLTGVDVAKYILSKIKCTHLPLEKLVYFAYADYLCDYSKRLFEDQIFAFVHGPVVRSVYETYKRSGRQYVEPLTFGEDSAVSSDLKEMPAKSRILFAIDGAEKICSIDKTLKTYGTCSAGELVDLTHRADSPWSHTDSSKPYQIISDEVIKKYHYIERF